MADAGWCYDPADVAEDGVTCFYCNMSLDGWEPKDDPMYVRDFSQLETLTDPHYREEHRRRAPDCRFFQLLERYDSIRPKAKGKRGRASNASKTSRLSTQSMQSTFSEAPSMMSVGDAGMYTDIDESLAIDSTILSDLGTIKGSKKTTKSKTAAKGRKKASKREESIEPSVNYSTIQDIPPEPITQAENKQPTPEPSYEQAMETVMEPEPVYVAPKPTRGRKAKRVDESRVEDSSVMEVDPPVKTKTGRAKAKKIEEEIATRLSEDESQLQSELQEAASFASALQSPPPRAKKGVKRTSEGFEKVYDQVEDAQRLSEPEVAHDQIDSTVKEAPAKPKKAPRATKTRKGKKAVQEDSEMIATSADESADVTASQPEPKPKRSRKAKKAPSEVIQPEPEVVETIEEVQIDEPALEQNVEPDRYEEELVPEPELEPELQQEELESEPELEEAQQEESKEVAEAIEENEEVFATPASATSFLPTPAEEEFEPTPTPQKPRQSNHQIPPSSSTSNRQTPRASATAVARTSIPSSDPTSPTQSTQSSDAENHPPLSSSIRAPPSTIKKSVHAPTALDFPLPPPTTGKKQPQQPTITASRAIFASPAKVSRIPLLPGTPSRSPSRLHRSPSKLLGTLTSSTPWTVIDLETVFSDDGALGDGNGNGKAVLERLVEAGGALTSEERNMSVDQWVRWRAECGEKRLRGECERLVGVFEREGGRAREVLEGIRTA